MTEKPYRKVFVSDGHKYALLDPYNHLRAVSYNLEGVAIAKHEWGWKDGECKIVRIKLDEKGIHYLQEVK
jgi:hypothetical protein